MDVLPDREADTFAAWLRDHPGVEVICRDRAGGYAEGATKGAPDAIQVADRWHLIHNLSEVVRKVVAAHRRCLRTVSETPSRDSMTCEQDPAAVSEQNPPPRVEGRRAANTRARHAAVHELKARGMSHKAISRTLQLCIKTIRRYARAQSPDQLLGPNPPTGRDVLAAFKPYLHARLDQDPSVATDVLLAELRDRGYRGSQRTLRRYLSQARQTKPAAVPPPPGPSARQITGWIMRPDGKLDEADRLGLKTACQACPELAALAELAQRFKQLVRTRGGAQLEELVTEATNSPFSEVRGFAKGLYSDFDAVKTGLTLEWSSGKAEGNVTRVILWNQVCQALVSAKR